MCVLSVVEIDGTPYGMVTNCVDTTFRYNRGFTIALTRVRLTTPETGPLRCRTCSVSQIS